MVWLPVALLLPLSLTLPATLWCTHRAGLRHPWLVAGAVAPPLGLGISSCIFFLWLSLPSARLVNLVLIELLLYLPAGIAFSSALMANRTHRGAPAPAEKPDHLGYIIAVVSLTAFACSGLAFILFSCASPHGDFDASAVWNLRARFLYRLGPGQWRDAFPAELPWAHPDYPLLLSASVARCWLYVGTETTWAPRLIAAIFTFALAGLLYAAVANLRSGAQAFLALAALVGTPQFVDAGSSQYADMPLSFYLLSALVCLVIADNRPNVTARCEALAGAMAGMAAWTKNEGCLCLLVLLTVRFVSLCLAGSLRRALKELAPTVLGALPVVVVLLYFKVAVAPPNDLMASQHFEGILGKLVDPARYSLILKFYGQEFLRRGGIAFFLAGYWLLMGRAPRDKRIVGAGQSFAVVLLLLLGYFGVYLITYWNLGSHLTYSVKRLWLHVYPAALFAFFLYTAAPEEALTHFPHGVDSGSPRPLGLDGIS